MNNYDPRVLVRAFDILQEKFQQFNQISSDTLNQAEHTQKCAQERFNQALRSSAITLNQAKSDLEDVQMVNKEVDDLLLNSSAAIEIAHQTVEMVDRSRQQAQITLATWQNELQKALVWQARAEARLANAIQEYEQAQRNLASAQQAFSSAEGSLQRCRNDSERKSCSGEERDYNIARETVALALQKLQEAEIEVQAAQEELVRAKARVRCCQQAVGYAEQAVQYANLATEQAMQALNEAERSLESAESANRAVAKASSKATEEQEQTEQAIDLIHQAEDFITQAKVSTQIARSKADSAYSLAKRGSQELEYCRDQLIRLNQISSAFKGAFKKSVAVVQTAVDLLGGIASPPIPNITRFGLQDGESLVSEAGIRSSSANEEEIKRRQEEMDIADRVANESKISAPPDPPPVKNTFFDNLKYEDSYNYLDREDGYRSIRIQVKNDGQEIAFITAEKTSNNRIKIKDTIVSSDLQGKGVGSGLLSKLEGKFPKGTELYFEENQAPDFWAKKGFQKRILKDGATEFFKSI